MQRTLDMQAIFPIKDAASAAVMAIKADCLHKAGIINEPEKRCIQRTALSHLTETSAVASRRHVGERTAGLLARVPIANNVLKVGRYSAGSLSTTML